MSDDLSREGVREAVREILGLAGGFGLARAPTGKFNETFFVEGGGLDAPVVVRVAPPDGRAAMIFYEHRMMRQEPGIHAVLREKTAMPVPEVLHFAEMHEAVGRDVIVMERLRGDPVMGGTDAVFRELGARLREVHDEVRAEPGRYGYLGEHEPMEAQASWGEAFAVMWEALLGDIERCGGASGEELASWRGLLGEHRGCFDHYTEPASLLHMDVWAENILVDEAGCLSGLIDWDRALWGDPEIEFAVLDYCGISTGAFWEGYGLERAADREAQVRRVFYLLYEVLKYIVIRIARQGNRAGAERYRSMAGELIGSLAWSGEFLTELTENEAFAYLGGWKVGRMEGWKDVTEVTEVTDVR
jgi:aminoglycoside phosphotransferase (APT) family kinase protein